MTVRVTDEVRREPVDVDMLVQAVIALGEQLHEEEEVLKDLQNQDSRIQREDMDDMLAYRLGGHHFLLQDNGKIVCRFPEKEYSSILELPMAHPWRPYGRPAFDGWVVLPSNMSWCECKPYIFIAVKYAAEMADHGFESPLTLGRLWILKRKPSLIVMDRDCVS